MQSSNIINDVCWVAYFDILGFENLLHYAQKQWNAANLDVVVRCYHEEILRYIECQLKRETNFTPVGFDYVCSSDSFVFFTVDDSNNSYLTIDRVGRFFFRKMIWKGIPFRGALAIGDFYADKQKNIFVGQGLIDAYKYAEKQDWIGFVLTPRVYERLSGTNLDLRRRSDYVEYDVPIKRKEIADGIVQIRTVTEKLFAHRVNKYPHIEESVMQMQEVAKSRYGKDYEDKYKGKYENTLEFIRTTRLRLCLTKQDNENDDFEK